MGTYTAIRYGTRTVVSRPNGSALPMRHDLKFYAPRHDWGFGGTAPSQLALDLVADRTHDVAEAIALAPYFKRLVLMRLPKNGWRISEAEIDRAIAHARVEAATGRTVPAR